MEPQQLLTLGQDAIFVFLKTAGPIMLIALGTGFTISLVQALTQIQEATLTFVPKIIAIFLSLILLMPYMSNQLQVFSQSLVEHIVMHP